MREGKIMEENKRKEELKNIVKEWVQERKTLPGSEDISRQNGLFCWTTLIKYFGSIKDMYKECCLIEEQEEKKEIKTQKTKIVKRPLSNGYIDARYNNHPELLRH